MGIKVITCYMLLVGILTEHIISNGEPVVKEKLIAYKESLKQKIVKANEELGAAKYRYRTN